MDGRYRVLMLMMVMVWTSIFSNVAGNIPVLACPLECTCTGTTVKCSNTRSFPEDLPIEMTEFHLTDSVVNYVPLNVFLNIPRLDRITLTSVYIHTLRACSFGERENTAEILFKNVTIQLVEGNAFSNLVNISKLWFEDSTIHEMKSFSIHGATGVSSIKFKKTKIDIIHPNTFLRIGDAGELVFEDCMIGKLLRNGISRFEKIEKFRIFNTTITILQCGSLQTFSTDVTTVSVEKSYFNCDCNLAWAWQKDQHNMAIFDDSNLCLSSKNKISLSSKTIAEICPDEESRDDGCPRMLLPSTPHACMRKFDTPYEPVEKIDYPKYFSRKPSGKATRIGPNVFQLAMLYIFIYLKP